MNDWVYSRTALAEHFLNSLEIGLVNRLALFGPRRRGKSLFLIHDLIPLAEKRGYFPVYASLWDNLDHPHIPILDSLRGAKQLIQKRGKLTTLLTTPITKLTLGNAVIKADIEFSQDPKAPSSDELSELSALITDISHIKPNKTLLLLIDEVQHIATHEAFKSIAYTLRTAADKNQDRVKIIFTGSSRTGMRELFDKNNAAFYNAVERMDFPVLDDGFIEFCQQRLQKDYEIDAGFDELKACFIRFDYSPYWFISILFKLILYKLSLIEASAIVHDEIIEAEGYAVIYKKLKPLDKQLLIAIANGDQALFSEANAERLSSTLGKPVKITTLQYTVNRLMKLQLITKLGRSDYVIERPGLAQYILNQNCP